MPARTPRIEVRPDVPTGLVARLRGGPAVRIDRVVAARDRLLRGEQPAPSVLADALVSEGLLAVR
jgi:hypothetical protein